MSEADICWNVRTFVWRWSLWPLSSARMTISAPLAPNSGSNATTCPLKIDLVAVAPVEEVLTSMSLPIPRVSNSVSMLLPSGSATRIVAELGSSSVSRTRTSSIVSRIFGSSCAPPASTSTPATCFSACGGHQPSSLGRLSARPRRRCIGFSIPLASAIARHVVASPYAS